MGFESRIDDASNALAEARALLDAELRAYPTPISGCDAQYNYLVGMRASVSDALRLVETPRFVATPRTPEPAAGVESR